VAVDPMMMQAGMIAPMIPPAPMAAPMAAPTTGAPPAVEALPGIAALAQQQTIEMLQHEKQMMEMQERMQKEIMMLIASLPTPNPAGEAAVSTPMTPMMSGPNTSGMDNAY
jgi:alpha-D-ribose 1-methylphosphonate 5-triphosphate diphosphatase PhnM